MFGLDHKQHQFEKLSVVYERHFELIRKEGNGLRKRLKELNVYMSDIQLTIEKVTKSKEEKQKETELFVENI
jgi:tripartite motif-containing protein 37